MESRVQLAQKVLRIGAASPSLDASTILRAMTDPSTSRPASRGPSPVQVVGTFAAAIALVAGLFWLKERDGARLNGDDSTHQPQSTVSPAVLSNGRDPALCAKLEPKLAKVCPRASLVVDKCRVVDADPLHLDPERRRQLEDGRYVTFGRPGPEWYMDSEGHIYTANDDAIQSCAGMQNIDEHIRARILAAFRDDDPNACSISDVAQSAVIAYALDVANDEPVASGADLERAERRAMTRAASLLGITRKQVEKIWYRVERLCPETTRQVSDRCTGGQIIVARAAVEALDAEADKANTTPEIERVPDKAYGSVSKKFKMKPAAVESILSMVKSYCPTSL